MKKDFHSNINEDKKDEQREEIEQYRSQKLMNSKDNNRKIIVFQFLFFSSLLVAYFVVSFIFESKFLDKIREIYNLDRILGERPSILKYTIVFTWEEFATNKSIIYKNVNTREMYMQLIYTNEAEVLKSIGKSLPSDFSPYVDKFLKINYNNICTNYLTNDAEIKSKLAKKIKKKKFK